MTQLLPASAEAIQYAAAILRRGGVVAFPTETVYGLGANALDATAVQRIFDAKGRPAYNPLIVHVPDIAAARNLALEWSPAAERLASAFWPGPLTLVVPKRTLVPDAATAGLPAVALRVPSHPIALELLRTAGVPVAAPSANRSGEVSPTTAAHVQKSLDGRIDLILDGGATDVGIESTVVDVTGPRPALLRPGLISADDLERHLGGLGTVSIVTKASAGARGEAPRPSPGMLDRHYAPKARLCVARFVDEARASLHRALAVGQQPTGALLHSFPDLPADHIVRLPSDPTSYSRGLYAALHTLDDLGCRIVVVEAVPATTAWDGVRDRLTRAATPDTSAQG